jgi:S-(hydroxymethyl)glutathione dehydrogenase/alcohol dehydrogenase
MSRVVVGYDGSACGEDALVLARRICRATGDTPVVVTVYPDEHPIGVGRVDAEWVGAMREEAERRLETARELGATHVVDASSQEPVQAIRDMTDGGVDYAFEAIGLKKTAEQAFACIRRGGTATIIGMIPEGQMIELEGIAFLRGEKKIQGSLMGSNRFKVDMPRYVDYYLQGQLKLDEMITRRGRLEDINEAFRAMKAGEVARTVLVFD